jgi:hypothetical protein
VRDAGDELGDVEGAALVVDPQVEAVAVLGTSSSRNAMRSRDRAP